MLELLLINIYVYIYSLQEIPDISLQLAARNWPPKIRRHDISVKHIFIYKYIINMSSSISYLYILNSFSYS